MQQTQPLITDFHRQGLYQAGAAGVFNGLKQLISQQRYDILRYHQLLYLQKILCNMTGVPEDCPVFDQYPSLDELNTAMMQVQHNEHYTVEMPTGSGKSGIMAVLPYCCNTSSVLVLAPSPDLARKLHADFCGTSAFVVKVGLTGKKFVPSDNCLLVANTHAIIAEKLRLKHQDLVVVNAQKFQQNAFLTTTLEEGNDGDTISEINLPADSFDLILVDEAHHYPAATWATFRSDGRPVAAPNKLISLSTYEAEKAMIIRPVNFSMFGNINDTRETEASDLCMSVVQSIMMHDQQEQQLHKAIIVCSRIGEVQIMSTILEPLLAPHGFQKVCYTSNDNCSSLDCFNDPNSPVRVAIVVNRLTEGYDNRNVSTVGIYRNIQSKQFLTQVVGRARRVCPGFTTQITANIIVHVNRNLQELINWIKRPNVD
ncbi:hypothetical protein GEMRC1_011140 [Eukaryota sp. GEM-RC1]